MGTTTRNTKTKGGSMSDMLERENKFTIIERLKAEEKLEEDERLLAEGRRDELVGKCEEWMGGCATRDELDIEDHILRVLIPLGALEL